MRTLGVLTIAASIGLLSHGALGRPVPPRVIYPYPIYLSDSPTVLDLHSSGRQMSESQARLGLSFAALSKAVEVGFVNVVIRPHEHLVSLLRYYKSPARPENLVSHLVGAKHALGWPTNNFRRRHLLGNYKGSEENTESSINSLPAHDHRRRESDDPGASAVRAPDYRRSVTSKRSSTHAVAGEHLKT
ncbi:unnamed protein product [Rhizoctonia solani]|uniref:Uncharacterized protein n=1 Tax=Rhizoctonia solani TaxID=456999 RepID=A0A8H3CEP1_9AGAM|nr:unnamed protein product [Rhizoctonia solani]